MLVTIKLIGLEDFLKKNKIKAGKYYYLGVLSLVLSYCVSGVVFVFGNLYDSTSLCITAAICLIFLQIASGFFFGGFYEAIHISGYSNAENFVNNMLNGNIFVDADNILYSDNCSLDGFDYIVEKTDDNIDSSDLPYLLGHMVGRNYVFSLYLH